MKPARSNEDRFLALLARNALPLERTDFVSEFGCTRQGAAWVLERLVKAGRVVATPGIGLGEGSGVGRPGLLYSLPGAAKPAVALLALLRLLRPDTIVLTPSRRDARIENVSPDGFAEVRYLDDIAGEPVTIHVRLLRVLQPGRERPDPVRFELAVA